MSEKDSLAKLTPACKSVLGPSYWIFEIDFINLLESFVNAETNFASSIVPSLEISVFVEKLTAPIFNWVLSFNRFVIKVFAESITKSSLVFPFVVVSVILFELSITSITSPVGFDDSSLFVTFNCNVISLFFKSFEITLLSTVDFVPKLIVAVDSSTTVIVTSL